MRSLFFFWLTFSLASVGHSSLADLNQFDILGLQADDAITTIPLTTDSRTPTDLVVADNPMLGLEFGAQDQESGQQLPGEDSIESNNNNNQQEGRSKADTSKCHRSAPRSRSSGAKRRREELNYCPNELRTGPSPSQQQQQKVRPPTGNMGNNEGKPGGNKNPLLSPDEAKSGWAPSLSDFYEEDPCQDRH